MNFLEFERPIAELEAKIEELRHVGSDAEINISEEIERLQQKSVEMTEKIFNNLTAWQVVQIARHPLRPYSLDYISRIFTEFDELHGDRLFSDDRAIVAGFAILEGQAVMVIGQQKGRDTKEKVLRNFGMPQPEGYRKALRLMHLAEKFNLPIITLIDTPGAYPGVGAEARGQSEAIAKNLFEMSTLRVPVINLIIGEGCSGGALGLEYAYYATISPEGCATILFKGAEHAAEAAEIMSITAKSHLANGIIDEIIPEPLGSAYRNFDEIANTVKESLVRNLRELQQLSITDLLKIRFDKLMSMGAHS
jgi:acetyl-CoA carboxylase carboxyl transferase subunit alpha